MASQIYSACDKKKSLNLGKRHIRVARARVIHEKATNFEEQKRKLKEMIKRNM